jgi:hypothetical protein
MAHSSFGGGWPSCNRSRIVTLVRSDGLRIPLHQDLIDLVQICLDVTEALGYDVKSGQTWGYACRPIAGTNKPSNHSWGTGVDINSLDNPRRARGLPMVTNIPRIGAGSSRPEGDPGPCRPPRPHRRIPAPSGSATVGRA